MNHGDCAAPGTTAGKQERKPGDGEHGKDGRDERHATQAADARPWQLRAVRRERVTAADGRQRRNRDPNSRNRPIHQAGSKVLPPAGGVRPGILEVRARKEQRPLRSQADRDDSPDHDDREHADGDPDDASDARGAGHVAQARADPHRPEQRHTGQGVGEIGVHRRDRPRDGTEERRTRSGRRRARPMPRRTASSTSAAAPAGRRARSVGLVHPAEQPARNEQGPALDVGRPARESEKNSAQTNHGAAVQSRRAAALDEQRSGPQVRQRQRRRPRESGERDQRRGQDDWNFATGARVATALTTRETRTAQYKRRDTMERTEAMRVPPFRDARARRRPRRRRARHAGPENAARCQSDNRGAGAPAGVARNGNAGPPSDCHRHLDRGHAGFNFFLSPVGTLTIADPQNWIALVAFLIVRGHRKQPLRGRERPRRARPSPAATK